MFYTHYTNSDHIRKEILYISVIKNLTRCGFKRSLKNKTMFNLNKIFIDVEQQ